VFNKIFAALAAKGGTPSQLMIDATHMKAHRTAASLLIRLAVTLPFAITSQNNVTKRTQSHCTLPNEIRTEWKHKYLRSKCHLATLRPMGILSCGCRHSATLFVDR